MFFCLWIKGISVFSHTHRYRKSLNRLPKVCYVPTTRAVLIAFFSSFFLLWPLTVLMKQARQLVRAIKQLIYLDVYGRTVSCPCSFHYLSFNLFWRFNELAGVWQHFCIKLLEAQSICLMTSALSYRHFYSRNLLPYRHNLKYAMLESFLS